MEDLLKGPFTMEWICFSPQGQQILGYWLSQPVFLIQKAFGKF